MDLKIKSCKSCRYFKEEIIDKIPSRDCLLVFNSRHPTANPAYQRTNNDACGVYGRFWKKKLPTYI